jgi:hypothetical protein
MFHLDVDVAILVGVESVQLPITRRVVSEHRPRRSCRKRQLRILWFGLVLVAIGWQWARRPEFELAALILAHIRQHSPCWGCHAPRRRPCLRSQLQLISRS